MRKLSRTLLLLAALLSTTACVPWGYYGGRGHHHGHYGHGHHGHYRR